MFKKTKSIKLLTLSEKKKPLNYNKKKLDNLYTDIRHILSFFSP